MNFGTTLVPTLLGTVVDGSAGTTLTQASVGVVADDVLIVVSAWNDTTSLTNVKYGSASFTQDATATNGTTKVKIWRYTASATDTQSIILTWSASTKGRAMTIYKIAGSASRKLGVIKDKTLTATGTSGSPAVGPTAAVTGVKEFIIMAVATPENSDAAAGAWGNAITDGQRVGTTGSPASSVTVSDGYRIVTDQPPQGYSASKTGLASTAWAMAIATYWGIAVSLEKYENGTSSGTISSHTFAFTGATGDQRYVLVGVAMADVLGQDAVTGVTYGGIAMSLVSQQTSLWVYELANPPTGSVNVIASYDGSTAKGSIISVMQFAGAKQVSPTTVSATSGNSDVSLNLPTTDGSALGASFLAIQDISVAQVTPDAQEGTQRLSAAAGTGTVVQGLVSDVTGNVSEAGWSWAAQGLRPYGNVVVFIQPALLTVDDWLTRIPEHNRYPYGVVAY